MSEDSKLKKLAEEASALVAEIPEIEDKIDNLTAEGKHLREMKVPCPTCGHETAKVKPDEIRKRLESIVIEKDKLRKSQYEKTDRINEIEVEMEDILYGLFSEEVTDVEISIEIWT